MGVKSSRQGPRKGALAAALVGVLLAGPARAQAPGAAAAGEPAKPAAVANSALDALMFYQLLIGELEFRNGQAGTAYQVVLDAARRSRDEQLFRRAVEIALQAHAGEQALAAVKAWRSARPESLEALRLQLQILTSMNKLGDTAEPLRALLAATPAGERAGVIATLPRFFQRATDKRQAAQSIDTALQPYLNDERSRAAARVASGRAWLAAGDSLRAFDQAQRAFSDDPAYPGSALLALELASGRPEAEALVRSYVGRPGAEPVVRLNYVRLLADSQRYVEAIAQLEQVTAQQPNLMPPWLTLGALHLELKQSVQAEAALNTYVRLARSAAPVAAEAGGEDDEDEEGGGNAASAAAQGLNQAHLLLAQAAEQRGDFAAAEAALAQVDNPQRIIDVQTRRAILLARQGKLAEARELVRRAPERNAEDARAKLLGEAQVLREVKRWKEAYELLEAGAARFSGDPDLLYEQAMMAEKLDRLEAMETLLRRVIATKPDHPHAHNALGYSLAERNLRLPEAKKLIQRALELSPGDPFITDSLGWVEYRLGNHREALRHLRSAYAARPDTEIGAHLGEVLWALGQRDEALKVWREARVRDAGNEVLRETLARLKADL